MSSSLYSQHVVFPEKAQILSKRKRNNGYEEAEILIGPFQKGFATTVANSLRRTLISSIPGFALAEINLNGFATSLYDSVDSLGGTVLDLSKQLSEVVIKSANDSQVYNKNDKIKAKLLIKKSNLVGNSILANSIKFENNEFFAINEDKLICKIINPEKLVKDIEIDLIYRYGIGNDLNNDLISNFNEYGVIKMDCNYSPIKSVSYEIGSSRVGSDLSYENIKFTIITDGSTSTSAALDNACLILSMFFNQISSLDATNILPESKTQSTGKNIKKIEDIQKFLKQPIEGFDLSPRTINSLKRQGINLLSSLVTLEESEMLKIPNLGKKSICEILDFLQEVFVEIKLSKEELMDIINPNQPK